MSTLPWKEQTKNLKTPSREDGDVK